MSVPAPIIGKMGLQLPTPNAIDRVVNYLSPVHGARRLHARALLALAGGYTGARSDRRATQEWNPRIGSADSDSVGDIPTLRGRSRDAIRNMPIATGAQNTTANAVVGWGLDPHPTVDREYLGLTQDEANAWERQAKRLYWLWASSPTACDFAGRSDMVGLTDLAFRSAFASGDVLAVRRFVEPNRNELFGLRVQLIEADRVCNPAGMPDSETLVSGVELDANGRAVRYHIMNRHPGDTYQWASWGVWHAVPAFGPADGVRQVLHFYKLLRPGQTRGVPELAPVIEALRQITQYSESELMAAVVSSFFTVFVKTAAGDPSSLAEVSGLPASSKPEAVAKGQYRMGPASILDLAEGEEIELANPMRPNAQFEPFFNAMMYQIGPAIGMPGEVLLQRFQASYSASMASLQEAWRGFRTSRSRTVRGFNQPIYEWLITEAVVRGHLRAPGFFDDPLARAAWCGAQWTGPSRGHLNPSQEATAMKTRIETGVTTLAEETAEYSGRDWEDNHEQRVLERKMIVAGGLDAESSAERIRTEPVQPAPAAVPPDDTPEEGT